MAKKLYRLQYNFQPGKYTKKQLLDSKMGGCDQALICSVVNNSDGSASYAFPSSNGEAGGAEMSVHTQFKVWALLAKLLSEDERLGPGRRQVCDAVFQTVRAAVLATNGECEEAGAMEGDDGERN